MRDLRRYWQEIRAIQKTLPEYVWLMSIEDELEGQVGGRLVEVSSEVAAKMLHAKSHRLATDEELREWQSAEEMEARRVARERLQRRGVALVEVSAEPSRKRSSH